MAGFGLGTLHPTVAAADAPQWVKTGAKYVTDTSDSAVDVIWKAINGLPSSGGTVQLSQGTFNIGDPSSGISNGSPFDLPDNVKIIGAGKELTRLNLHTTANADRYMFRIISSSGDYDRTGWGIEGLHISCSQAQHHGIGIMAAENGYVRDVKITHTDTAATTDEGIQFAASTGSVRRVTLEDVEVSGFRIGIEVRAGDSAGKFMTDLVMNRLNIYGCQTDGLQLWKNVTGGANAPARIWIRDGQFHDNDQNGVNIQGAEHVWFEGGNYSSNTWSGINMTDTAANINYLRIRDGYFGFNTRSGLVADGTRHSIITNTFEGNSSAGMRGTLTQSLVFNNIAIDSAGAQEGFKEQSNPVGNIFFMNYANGNSADYQFGSNVNSSFGENDS